MVRSFQDYRTGHTLDEIRIGFLGDISVRLQDVGVVCGTCFACEAVELFERLIGDEGEELVLLVYREFSYCISCSYHNSNCNHGVNPLFL